MSSSPRLPKMVSPPPRPNRLSLPARPSILSGPPVPLIVFGPSVPLKLSASAIPAVIVISAATNTTTIVALRMHFLLARMDPSSPQGAPRPWDLVLLPDLAPGSPPCLLPQPHYMA